MIVSECLLLNCDCGRKEKKQKKTLSHSSNSFSIIRSKGLLSIPPQLLHSSSKIEEKRKKKKQEKGMKRNKRKQKKRMTLPNVCF